MTDKEMSRRAKLNVNRYVWSPQKASEAAKKSWAGLTPEQRQIRLNKMRDGRAKKGLESNHDRPG